MVTLVAQHQESERSVDEQWADHKGIVEGYLDTHLSRNHTKGTHKAEERFLTKWFRLQGPGDEKRPLFVWEAMEPVLGRERVVAYMRLLAEKSRPSPATSMQRMGVLRRFFQYVLEWPYIPGSGGVSIRARYGPIEQPVLSYDFPAHRWGGRREDAPLTRPELERFYEALLSHLRNPKRRSLAQARNYTMFVLAAESGLRCQEICLLETERDLLFESDRVQTRHGKGDRGSGPKVRQTIFTPFAQATVRHYLEHVRPLFRGWSRKPWLFLSERGRPLGESGATYGLQKLTAIGRDEGLRIPPRFGWHSLRRSFSTIFMEERPDSPWVLMEMLGHSNPSTLHHYIHHPRAYHERVMDEFIDRLIPR